ncbi:hypothetical protein [Mycetocola miduiensis]|uniref:hypothetical protein n=1 Tax=Mycetocola miduiensis TaxID=995034 RepID=UPI0015A7073F|nr:hypothetical protein [Mycetocola miduiensis]
MSYITARELADKASTAAKRVNGIADDPGVVDLARAVDFLAQSVSELASQLHRDS